MKDRNKKGTPRRVLMYALLLAAAIGAGLALKAFDFAELAALFTVNGTALLKLALLVFGVLLAENLVVLVLGLIRPTSHRACSVLSLTASLVRYVAVIVILCGGLGILGVNIGTIIASVVIGAFMLLENQYNVGDIVEVNGFRGTVTSIGIRTTCITDSGDNVKIINNSEMKNILNRSDNSSKTVCDISIPYETDIETLETRLPALLEEIYRNHTDTMESAPVYLGVQALEASGILLRFVVNVSERNVYSTARILNRDLLLGFRRLGVECPYPQLDVHNR